MRIYGCGKAWMRGPRVWSLLAKELDELPENVLQVEADIVMTVASQVEAALPISVAKQSRNHFEDLF